ncbi:THAP domain-containing protein [Operophtera brumata]|uniref:THAP domain-containing protein n=1 Tax=Operophtera brumata TaxID=104452 RepID=A0A0L7LU54_OPEBR|nr:THAP domain-containing protein [Operophtera brumata]
MPYYCTVPRCTSMAGKAKNVSFHQFPRDEELARLWNDILKRGKPYTKYSKVCSLHFKPEDYTITSVGKNKAPYSRKQWESWSQNSGPAHVMDSSTNTDCTSYKCTECTKCFKDPDVFILHKRSHTKDIKSNGVEKENFNMNVTLRSNPILANLLKTNNEANFDPNIVTMENILMTALAANMDYLRSFSTVKDGDTYDGLNNDRGDGSHDRSNIDL